MTMLEIVMVDGQLMMVPVIKSREELRDACATGRITMFDPFLYHGMVCEVVATWHGEFVLKSLCNYREK